MDWRWRNIDRDSDGGGETSIEISFFLTSISYRCLPIASVANLAIFPLDLVVFKFQMGINCNTTASENFSCFPIKIGVILNL